jgi:hypothetical protein
VGDENLQIYIYEYYKKLFGEPATSTLTMNEDFCQDIHQLTLEENNILVAKFTEKEVKDTIFQMEVNKASRPDGFLWNFIKNFGRLLRMI